MPRASRLGGITTNKKNMALEFNSAEYGWNDITAVAGGRVLNGIRGLKYGEKIEREYLYAKGNKPWAIQDKNISYEGELTVLQSELEAFIKSSGKKSILNITLETLTISYAPLDGALVTDQLRQIKFTESFKEMKQDDGFMEITLPIMFLDLKHQI